jgi:hypothetical protein
MPRMGLKRQPQHSTLESVLGCVCSRHPRPCHNLGQVAAGTRSRALL